VSDLTPTLTVPAAGWYSDRNDATVQRWWDGGQWTDDARSIAPAASVFGLGAAQAVSQPIASPTAYPVAPQLTPQSTATVAAQPTVAAAWYADPTDASITRWWDGQRWTQHTAPISPAAAPSYSPNPSYALSPGSLSGSQPVTFAPNSLATGALIVGLVSILINPLGAASISAIVMGIVALRRARNFAPTAARRGSAIAGIVIAVAAIVIGAILAIVVIQAKYAADAPKSTAPYTSGTPKSVDQLTTLITNDMQKYGAVSRVDCPTDASVAPGAKFDCQAVFVDGRTTTVDVSFNADGGYGIGFSPPASSTGG
jgi:Protein of unknown function (DUF2510)/Domain of unknown function (DUF4333)